MFTFSLNDLPLLRVLCKMYDRDIHVEYIVLSYLHGRNHKYRSTIYTIAFEKLTKISTYLCSLTLVSNIRPFVLKTCFRKCKTN